MIALSSRGLARDPAMAPRASRSVATCVSCRETVPLEEGGGDRPLSRPPIPWSDAVEAARPSPAEVMSDRDGRGHRHLCRIVGAGGGARHHLPDLLAREPARLGELLGV